MLEQARLRQRSHVPFECSRRNSLPVAIHSCVPIRVQELHARNAKPKQAGAKVAAKKWRQALPVRRIRIHRRHQHQASQVQPRVSTQTFRGSHHRHGTAMRGSQQIKRSNSQLRDEAKKALRRPPHRVIDPDWTIRKPRSHHVRRIHRGIRRQSRHCVAPGKRISQQAVQQN